MSGDVREWSYPVLNDGIQDAVSNKGKAEMLVNAFVNIHSSNNLGQKREGKAERIPRNWRL